MSPNEAERIGTEAALLALYQVLDRCGARGTSLPASECREIVDEVIESTRSEVDAIFGEELGAPAAKLLSGVLGVSSYVVNEATRCVEGQAGWSCGPEASLFPSQAFVGQRGVSGRDAT